MSSLNVIQEHVLLPVKFSEADFSYRQLDDFLWIGHSSLHACVITMWLGGFKHKASRLTAWLTNERHLQNVTMLLSWLFRAVGFLKHLLNVVIAYILILISVIVLQAGLMMLVFAVSKCSFLGLQPADTVALVFCCTHKSLTLGTWYYRNYQNNKNRYIYGEIDVNSAKIDGVNRVGVCEISL